MEDGAVKRKFEKQLDSSVSKENFSIFNTNENSDAVNRKILISKTSKRVRAKSEERPRSPSGQRWSPKVKSIKEFLLSKNNPKNKRKNTSEVASPEEHVECSSGQNSQPVRVTLSQKTSQPQRSVNAIQLRSNKVQINCSRKAGFTNFKINNGLKNQSQTSQHRVNYKTISSSQQLKKSTMSGTEAIKETCEMEIQNATSNEKSLKDDEDSKSPKSVNEVQKEADELIRMFSCGDSSVQETMAKTVDVRVVMKMISTLRADLVKMESKIEKVSSDNNPKEKIEALEAYTENNDKEIQTMQEQLDEYKIRTTILTGAVGKMNQVISELQEKVEKLEAGNCRRSIIIHGFYADVKKHVRIQQIQDFIREEMCVNATVEDAYFLGGATPPSIVISLASFEEKKEVLENGFRIKNYVNKDDKKMYFKEYIPQSMQEEKIRRKQVIQHVRSIDPDTEVKFMKNGVKLKDNFIPKKITVPDPTEILQMEENELTEILNMKVSTTPKAIVQNNVFIGSYEQIQKAYMHVKLANAGARHIVCVWNIPDSENSFDACDYLDDDEHGMGRYLAEYIIKHNISFRAFFIVRYYNDKIGPKRYDAYLDAVKSAIKQAPYNKITKTTQNVEEISETGDSESPPHKRINARREFVGQRGRGGGKGYQPRRNNNKEKVKYTPKSEEMFKKSERR